jgi:hypothetical protein
MLANSLIDSHAHNVQVAVSTPIQIFFAWRIKLLTKSSIIPVIISILAIVSLAGGTWTTVRVVQIKLFARKPELHHPALVWFIGACLADVIIAVVLVLKLVSGEISKVLHLES